MAGKFEKHIFICTNERAEGHPRGCCKAKQSEALVQQFKQEIKKKGSAALKFRAQRAGCLDSCEQGPSVVVYPDSVWYGNVSLEDVSEIVESHIIGGQPVERLRIFK